MLHRFETLIHVMFYVNKTSWSCAIYNPCEAICGSLWFHNLKKGKRKVCRPKEEVSPRIPNYKARHW